jgi:hypothetical protein
MKKVGRVFVYVSLGSAILILLAFGLFIRNTNSFFEGYYNQQLNKIGEGRCSYDCGRLTVRPKETSGTSIHITVLI